MHGRCRLKVASICLPREYEPLWVLKVSGGDFNGIAQVGAQLENLLPRVKGTRSVFAERPGEGFFLDIVWDRTALARYGLNLEDTQAVVQNAIGGENVTTTIHGRERYPVNVRYMRDFRSDFTSLSRVLVPVAGREAHVPLNELADIKTVRGPSMLRNEDGLLTGYVYVDVADRDIGSYVEEANKLVIGNLKLPPDTPFRGVVNINPCSASMNG